MTQSALLPPAEPLFSSVPGYRETLGPEVAELNERASFVPDPEQCMVLDAQFAMDRDGRSACFEVAVIAPRQNLKTGVMKMAGLGYLYVTEQPLVIWTAHEFSTTQEAFRDLKSLIVNCDFLRRRVKRIYEGNGDESIELLNGNRMLFRARTLKGGRGLSAPKVFLDEGMYLKPSHMGSLLPTMTAQPDPQVMYSSSAGLADSDVLRAIRDRGRAGDPGLAYFEWGTPRGCEQDDCSHERGTLGCSLDDLERLRQSNPQLREGGRVQLSTLQSMRKALMPAEYAREYLTWWDEPASVATIFGPGKWAVLEDEHSQIVSGMCFAVASSLDSAWTSIAVAGRREDGLKHWELVDRQRDVTWAAQRIVDLLEAHGTCLVVIDGKGPAKGLVKPLQDAGVDVTVLKTDDVLDAYAWMGNDVKDGAARHLGQEQLDDAVAGAQERMVGDRPTLGRKTSTCEISALEAVMLASAHVGESGPGFFGPDDLYDDPDDESEDP